MLSQPTSSEIQSIYPRKTKDPRKTLEGKGAGPISSSDAWESHNLSFAILCLYPNQIVFIFDWPGRSGLRISSEILNTNCNPNLFFEITFIQNPLKRRISANLNQMAACDWWHWAHFSGLPAFLILPMGQGAYASPKFVQSFA